MCLNHLLLHTDTTPITMSVGLSAAYTTDAAGGTVILSLILIIQQDTDGAPVGAQSCAASRTDLCRPLFFLTQHAFDCHH